MPGPHRRHRFLLNLEADTLEDLVNTLQCLAHEIEAADKEGRRLAYRGPSTSYQATLRTDPQQDGDRYREQLAGWHRAHCSH